ncbi:uncharacterized protein LOC125941988 [Dermacentor silvarum]|uniref:uncharacterized protein LOC125941988 n=1 Tax=Dermacentor silvarum TaxID=543639 RepID=UPI002100F466|nr:uncharacterized protein LOC125941988 [Dermacentor silvarum]
MANVGATCMRQCSSLDVVAKNTRHANISLDSTKYRALEKWSLSQVSNQQASMDIRNPAVNNGNFFYHANSGGLDLVHPYSPFTGNYCSSIITHCRRDGCSFQSGKIGENILEGPLSMALVTQRVSAIFQTALIISQAEALVFFCLCIYLVSRLPCLFFLFCIYLVSRLPCPFFCFAFTL